MANQKRKFDTGQTDSAPITGYVHEITDVSTSKTNVRYFNGTVQVKDDFYRMVCFSPEKHPMFSNAAQLKSPVKINNAVMVPSRDRGKKEIRISKMTNIELMDTHEYKRKKLEFQTSPVMQIEQLQQDRQTVTVNAQVITISQELQEVNIYGRPTLKKEYIIADQTESSEIALWGSHIDNVQEKNFYAFQDVQTRYFQDKIKLTTTPRSKITPIPSFQHVVDVHKDCQTSHTFDATIMHCTVKFTRKCSSCTKAIQDDAVGSLITKCSSCSMKQKSTNLTTSCIVQMNLKNIQTDTLHRVCAFEDAIKGYLKTISKDNLLTSPSDLEEHLLLMPVANFTLAKDIVTKISPLQAAEQELGSVVLSCSKDIKTSQQNAEQKQYNQELEINQ